MVKPDGTSLRAPARARRLKNAFAFAGWRVKTAPDEVGEAFCTQTPYREGFASDDALEQYSREHFHYYDVRNGRPSNGPYRYVHVVGADHREVGNTEDNGRSILCGGYGLELERWAYVFMGTLQPKCNSAELLDIAVRTTIHEVAHTAFLLEDHEDLTNTTSTYMDGEEGNPEKMKFCVMTQGMPTPRWYDYHFCPSCIAVIRSYGGLWCGGRW